MIPEGFINPKGLLNAAEIRAIRDAVQMVTDTFFTSPIAYYLHQSTMDVWNEDKSQNSFQTYNLMALVEYEEMEESKEEITGISHYDNVKITFNIEDLERRALIDTNFNYKFSVERDYFKCDGRIFKVNDIYYSGPLNQKDALLVVKGGISDRPLKGIKPDTNGN